MKQFHRLQVFMKELREKGSLSVESAQELASASAATVRRDFNTLYTYGWVEKHWGGISLIRGEDEMLPVEARQTVNLEAKKSIATRAAQLVNDGDVIFIDGGTTTLELARLLAGMQIRIITNSLLIAGNIYKESYNRNGPEILLIGGLMYPNSMMLVGPQANKNIAEYHADFCFLSAAGIQEKSVSNSNQLVVETERSFMKQSEQTIILADHSKFGKKSLVKMCDLSEIDYLITNRQADFESNETNLIKV